MIRGKKTNLSASFILSDKGLRVDNAFLGGFEKYWTIVASYEGPLDFDACNKIPEMVLLKTWKVCLACYFVDFSLHRIGHIALGPVGRAGDYYGGSEWQRSCSPQGTQDTRWKGAAGDGGRLKSRPQPTWLPSGCHCFCCFTFGVDASPLMMGLDMLILSWTYAKNYILFFYFFTCTGVHTRMSMQHEHTW